MTDQLTWFVVRSSGIVAWAFAAASVIWGLLLSTRALGRRPGGPWLLDLHRFLGTMTIVFVGVHLVGLWLDTHTHWAWAELFVPFASSWRPGPVAWGILAMYLLVAIQVSSRFMRRLPRALWRSVHWTSFVAYVAAGIHLVQAGSEARNPLLLGALATTSLTIVVLLALRVRDGVQDRRRRGADASHAAGPAVRAEVTVG